ncbi:hypothetical protein F7R12_02710 [Pseudomonas tolaasii]|nr:hypothetical protein F7R12_02710 [Pseudomonas tolaasii]
MHDDEVLGCALRRHYSRMRTKGSQHERGVQPGAVFIVDLRGRASVAATLLPVGGGVQQEKL